MDPQRRISGRSLVFEATSDEESAAYAWRENSLRVSSFSTKQRESGAQTQCVKKRSRREFVVVVIDSCPILLLLLLCVFCFPFFPNDGSRSPEMVVKKRDSH